MARLAGWDGGSSPSSTYLKPDLNQDGYINTADLELLKARWGTTLADSNNDQKTNTQDFGIMMSVCSD